MNTIILSYKEGVDTGGIASHDYLIHNSPLTGNSKLALEKISFFLPEDVALDRDTLITSNYLYICMDFPLFNNTKYFFTNNVELRDLNLIQIATLPKDWEGGERFTLSFSDLNELCWIEQRQKNISFIPKITISFFVDFEGGIIPYYPKSDNPGEDLQMTFLFSN
ncbi:hypothetical protein DRN73_08055 [Candidatus Pacearchaeota archaeon]|nr:MAG: hypothetical protein DRN73_08055 [Candidatus Pacearchaeota archaeon]